MRTMLGWTTVDLAASVEECNALLGGEPMTVNEELGVYIQCQREGIIADLEIGVGADAGLIRFRAGPAQFVNSAGGNA